MNENFTQRRAKAPSYICRGRKGIRNETERATLSHTLAWFFFIRYETLRNRLDGAKVDFPVKWLWAQMVFANDSARGVARKCNFNISGNFFRSFRDICIELLHSKASQQLFIHTQRPNSWKRLVKEDHCSYFSKLWMIAGFSWSRFPGYA